MPRPRSRCALGARFLAVYCHRRCGPGAIKPPRSRFSMLPQRARQDVAFFACDCAATDTGARAQIHFPRTCSNQRRTSESSKSLIRASSQPRSERPLGQIPAFQRFRTRTAASGTGVCFQASREIFEHELPISRSRSYAGLALRIRDTTIFCGATGLNPFWAGSPPRRISRKERRIVSRDLGHLRDPPR